MEVRIGHKEMSSISTSAYKILLACPGGLSRSQLFVEFCSSYDRKPHPNTQLEQSIHEIWKQRILVNPSLYNGTKFRYGGCLSLPHKGDPVHPSGNCLHLGLTDYRTFIGTNLSPYWESFLLPVEDDVEQCTHFSSPLGNGAIVETSDACVAVLERSQDVGEFPGHLVFPGGHSEPEELGISCHVDQNEKALREALNSRISQDMFDGIIREVIEEIGVPETTLSEPIFIGVSRRILNARPTAFFYIKCSLSSADVYSYYAKAQDGYESTNLRLMSKPELASAALKMPGCHHGGFALYELMLKEQQPSNTESSLPDNATA